MAQGNIIDAYELLIGLKNYKDSTEIADSIYDDYKNIRIKNANIGDIVLFGTYEQDGDTTNGKETVEWLVLEKDEKTLALISSYVLDSREFDPKFFNYKSNITWNNCELREWLNNAFLNEAFNDNEQSRIVSNSDDKVRLLSDSQLKKYFISQSDRKCKPTAYASTKHVGKDSTGYCRWWLDNGWFVLANGESGGFGNYLYGNSQGVRPCINVTIEANNSEQAIKDEEYTKALSLYQAGKYYEAFVAFEALDGYKDSTEKASEIQKMHSEAILKGKMNVVEVGDIVVLGSCEQDNNTSNGNEGIEWVVLSKDEEKMLLLSKYALFCQRFHSTDTEIAWEECYLRTWLNEVFFSGAFTSDEQAIISAEAISTDSGSGNDTIDKVFILSETEVYTYCSGDIRQCWPTQSALANGAVGNSKYDTCVWWLRSRGYYKDYAARVALDGSVYGKDSGSPVSEKHGIRPAVWIRFGN